MLPKWVSKYSWMALGCGVFALTLVRITPLRFFWAPDPRVLLEIRDDVRTFTDLSTWPAEHGRFENHGFVPCEAGAWAQASWCLPPHTAGTLRLTLPEIQGVRAGLARLFFFKRTGQATTRLAVFREGASQSALRFDNAYFADARLDFSSVVAASGGRVVLEFAGENRSAQPDVMLQQIELRLFGERLPLPPSVVSMTLAWCVLGLCALPFVSWRRLLPIWGIVSLAFALRYWALTQVLFFAPDYDAIGYHHSAQTMRLFTDTGFFSGRFGWREPLHVLLIKSGLWLLGDTDTHVQLVTLFTSCLVVFLTYRVARRCFGLGLGYVGALVMAVNLPLVRESTRGLRLELELVLLLVFIEAAFVARFRSRWARAISMGMAGGCLALTRMHYLINLLPLIVSVLARRQAKTWAATALAVLVMVGLYLPHGVHWRRVHGPALLNAQWWANLEFAGQPGWRAKQDVWRDAEGKAAVMGAGEYFFGLHTIPELVVGTLRGSWKIIRHMDVLAYHRGIARLVGFDPWWLDAGFQAMAIAGLLAAACTVGWRWLPVGWIGLLMHLPFLYDRGLVEVYRHTYHAFPFFLFGALYGIRLTHEALRRVRWKVSVAS